MSSSPPPPSSGGGANANALFPPASSDPEAEYMALLETSHKRLWLSFQHTAATVAKLYRDGHQLHAQGRLQGSSSASSASDPLWAAFQASAGSLTQFYKDTIEAMNTVQDKAVHYGYHKKRRESIRAAANARRQKQQQQANNHGIGRGLFGGAEVGAGGGACVASGGGAPGAGLPGSGGLNGSELSPLEFELEKTMLSDDLSASPLRTLKRRPPPADDILEAIFIKRARPS